MTSALLFYHFKENLEVQSYSDIAEYMSRYIQLTVEGGSSGLSGVRHSSVSALCLNHMWDLCCYRSTLQRQ